MGFDDLQVYNWTVSQPPPFAQPGPVPGKKNNTPLILVIIFVAFACVCVLPAVLLYNVGKFALKEGLPMAQCGIAFEHVREALEEYAKEHDGTLPKAATWQDDVRPYYRKIAEKAKDELGPIEPMGADEPWGCTQESGMTGIAFNEALGGKKLADIKDPEGTPLIFEVEKPSPNAHEAFKRRDRATGPMIMNEHRDWIVVNVKGSQSIKAGRGGSAKISID